MRILANNTIDNELWKHQKTKDSNISQIMQEDGVHRTPPTLEELAQIFGHNQEEAVEDNTIQE